MFNRLTNSLQVGPYQCSFWFINKGDWGVFIKDKNDLTTDSKFPKEVGYIGQHPDKKSQLLNYKKSIPNHVQFPEEAPLLDNNLLEELFRKARQAVGDWLEINSSNR